MDDEDSQPHQSQDNEQLGQRLTASNQALVQMQMEHRQLLEEMEQLRKRAENLQRLKEQQEREEQEKDAAIVELKDTKNIENNKEVQNEEDNDEEGDYIKEKLMEIARLKAQFKRVQHMINTTELIENHISKNEAGAKQSAKDAVKPKAKSDNIAATPESTTIKPESTAESTVPEDMAMPNMPKMADLNAATTSDEKEQLILTMLNMFQDFSSDLKSQADNLKAERERIKELKESIIRSRKDQHK